MHLIMGPCPCGHDPQPCTCAQAPKKSTSHPSCQDRQLELVAAAPQRSPRRAGNAPATPQRPVVRNNGHVNDETGTATVGNTVFCTPRQHQEAARPAQQGHRSPNVQQQNLYGLPSHRGRTLRHDRGQPRPRTGRRGNLRIRVHLP